jgi:hypothetical protein
MNVRSEDEDWVKLVKGCDEDGQGHYVTLEGIVVIFFREGRDEGKVKELPIWKEPRGLRGTKGMG